MITEELLSYIKKQLELGHSEATVRKILIDHKWKDTDVEQAFSTILGARPQNNQSDVASIMRPGFTGSQAQPQAQPQVQPQMQSSQFSQPQIQPQAQPIAQYQPQAQPQVQPIQITQPVQQIAQPVITQPVQQVEPQAMPVQQFTPVQASPIQQPEIKAETTFQINPKLQQFQTPTNQVAIESVKSVEVKSEGPVFMPKTFSVNQFAEADAQKKVQFGAVIQPTEVKEPLVNMLPDTDMNKGAVVADASSDFYKNLSSDSAETPALNTNKPELKSFEQIKNPDFKTGPIAPEGRVIGQSMLKPKTFGPKVYGSNIQSEINKMAPLNYGKFATPQAEENIPTLNKQATVPVGGTSPYLYEKNRPESITLREAQNKMPPMMASQNNPNIIDRPIVEVPKKSGGFFKKIIVVFICILVLGGGAYAYVKFFQSGINKDSRFTENFKNIYSADFEISLSGPVLSGVFPNSADSSLLTSKVKAFIDVADSSNKISNFEIDIKDDKDLNFNIVSSSASSYVYTTFEDFAYKNQWIQLNGPFVQSFLPSMLSGTLPNGLVADSGSVLAEASSLKIRQLFSQFQFLTFTYDKGNEEIDGKQMHAYSFVLDKGAIDLYLEQVEVLAKGSDGYEKAISSIKNLISTIEVKEGTIWIGDDGLPYRIVATLNTLGNSTTSQLSIQVNSYNEKKNVSIPNNFIKPDENVDGTSFAEGELKDSIREVFVDLQSIASSFKTTKNGSFVGVCQDTASGFSGRFKELDTMAPNIMPICKDGASGFLVGAKYTEGKYLCLDKGKITESDESGVTGEGLTCAVSKEANTEDTYIKETITAFSNIAKSYKTDNQNSFGGLCASSSYLIFSRGLESAVNKTAECLSSTTGFAVFSPLSTGEYACIDATAKYTTSTSPRTVASCK